MKKIILISLLLIITFPLYSQSKEKSYFALFSNADGEQYYTKAKAEPFYSMEDFLKASRRSEYYLVWSSMVDIEDGKIVKIFYDRSKILYSSEEQKVLLSIARFFEKNKELFKDDFEIAAYIAKPLSTDPEIDIELKELKKNVSVFLDSEKKDESCTFYSPFSGNNLSKNLYLAMLATQLFDSFSKLEAELNNIAETKDLDLSSIKAFLDQFSSSLGYMEKEEIDKGLQGLVRMFSLDITINMEELKKVKESIVEPKTEVKKPVVDNKAVVKAKVEKIKPLQQEVDLAQQSEIKQKIINYYINILPTIRTSLQGKTIQEMAHFLIVANIPNAERKNFRLDPKLLEILFGNEWHDWSDGVISIASKYSNNNIMRLFAIRFIANAPQDIFYYEDKEKLRIKKTSLSEFLSKQGDSQVAILKHVDEGLSDPACSNQDKELVPVVEKRLQNVNNTAFIKNNSSMIFLDNRVLVPKNEKDAIDLMKTYTLLESEDLHEQLDATLTKMSIKTGVIFGQEESELWFRKGLYEYFSVFSEGIDSNDSKKQDIDFVLLISGILAIDASTKSSLPFLTRRDYEDISSLQSRLGLGTPACYKFFERGMRPYKTRATYQFYSMTKQTYYRAVKY